MPRLPIEQHGPRTGWTGPCAILTLASLLCFVGCGRQTELDPTYGRSRGQGRTGVNGTAVLAGMFERQGMKVSTWRRLSPKLEKEDVLVWFPDSFDVPSQAEIDYLNAWLGAPPRRTLVYVGRDYDAAVQYWREVLERTRGLQRLRARRQLARLESGHLQSQRQLAAELTCDWFTLHRDVPLQAVQTLSGPWTSTTMTSNANIWLSSRMELPETETETETETEEADWVYWSEVRTLLEGDGKVLAAELRQTHWDDSRIILVNNGSWLLNLPLVNAEHRVLAAELIESCQPAERVCFLESGEGGLSISQTDNDLPLLLRMFTVPPMDVVMIHITVLGILYCFTVMPIFGRARRLADESTTDFGKHVAAVGDLLQRGQDTEYARHQLKHYRETVHHK